MSKLTDMLNDIDKQQVTNVTSNSSIPSDALLQGDLDGDGNMEWIADTDGDGLFDTVFELVSSFF